MLEVHHLEFVQRLIHIVYHAAVWICDVKAGPVVVAEHRTLGGVVDPARQVIGHRLLGVQLRTHAADHLHHLTLPRANVKDDVVLLTRPDEVLPVIEHNLLKARLHEGHTGVRADSVRLLRVRDIGNHFRRVLQVLKGVDARHAALRDPAVPHDVRQRDALGRVFGEHGAEQVLELVRDVERGGELELVVDNVLVELRQHLSLKGHHPKDENVQRYPQGPYISGVGIVPLPGGHLRRMEQRRPGGFGGHPAILIQHAGAAEVRNLDLAAGAEQHVVRLQVHVGDMVKVQVVQAHAHVSEVVHHHLLRHRPGAHFVRADGAALHVLHYHQQLGAHRVVDHLVKLDEVGVPELLHDGHLALEVGQRVGLLPLLQAPVPRQRLLVERLNGVQSLVVQVEAQADGPKVPLAERLYDHVLV
mmetsp:Transcript_18277/g.51184  ORF Transcript_18277/g.51184 Transcript_18277/m.51184 type:complete len:416 (-) Transcript_18277:386-1633(-)